MSRKVLVTLLLCLPVLASAAQERVLGAFAPKNNTKIFVGSENANPMTEELFNQILDSVNEIYTPRIKELGGTFELQRDWSDGTANAFATRRGNRWIIKMFGGLARHKHMTPDGFALVACHEIGHHIGGAPKRFGWASNEGQSDFYATAKCARVIWEKQDNFKVLKTRLERARRNGGSLTNVMSEIPKQACGVVFGSQFDGEITNSEALCVRSAMGGQSLANVLSALGRDKSLPDFATPDKKVVRRTNHRHPKAQCRLDTYLAGALCTRDKNELPDNKDPNVGYCNRAAGDKVGIRPLCWFKPPKALEMEEFMSDPLNLAQF